MVITDSKEALKLDSSYVKAYYCLGMAFGKKEPPEIEEAIAALKKALDHSNGQGDSGKKFRDDIERELAFAKKRRWEVVDDERQMRNARLQEYLHKAMHEFTTRQMQDATSPGERDRIKAEAETRKRELQDMLCDDDMRRKRREVPDAFCCKITLSIMREPYITPSGITYERAVLVEHLRKNGEFDPVTKAAVSASQLVPNIALKSAIHAYLDDNPWACDY